MNRKAILCLLLVVLQFSSFSQQTITQYLSGIDKDHAVQWDFYCTKGRKSGRWTKIDVPSNWEQQGFGDYNYGHDRDKHDEQGLYKHSFVSDHTWNGKKIMLVFEGVMTDAEVMVNGQLAGPIHQGAFYCFKYDITDLVKEDSENLLEVTVNKMSANSSVNEAERQCDFWVFGGIYRPVYLEILAPTFIDKVAINAKADGSFLMNVLLGNATKNLLIEAQIYDAMGNQFGTPFSMKLGANQSTVSLSRQFDQPLLWSAEFPNLYAVVVRIINKKKVIHEVRQHFGFRTIDLRPKDGLYVNGQKIILKGSNRHSFWPESGRTLSHELHVMDAQLMKEMNMNAVRMSHYPPDREFLNVCDSIGLYVIDELTGWQSKYDTEVGQKLVKELVEYDVNHPSIVFWANGNEGGWNTDLDNDYAIYDPQNRVVIHPWETFNSINTKHYPDYNYVMNETKAGEEVFMPTEFIHGLYDGGAGAGLDDFWNVMMQHPHAAGGFVWAFVDEGVMRTDQDGALDSDGNHAADGIVGPHREKEASFYTIKEIWSPIQVSQPRLTLDESFDNKLEIHNQYAFTNLSQCKISWQLVNFPTVPLSTIGFEVVQSGTPNNLELTPGQRGILDLNLPTNWINSDALYLTILDSNDKELFTWSWEIKVANNSIDTNRTILVSAIGKVENANELVVSCDGIKYTFDKKTGYINKVTKPDATVSLSNGPALAGLNTDLKSMTSTKSQNTLVVEAVYDGDAELHVKWTFAPDKLVQMEYDYSQQGEVDFMGITFDYPEEKITGMKWLGRGQYKVWKNRLKGQQLQVWHKDYNNSITGESFVYPEFKGYYAQVKWVVLENTESAFTVYTDKEDLFLQMLHPDREKDALKNNNVEPLFPKGNIGFLNGISAIGTKFKSPMVMGPQSQKNVLSGEKISGLLWFEF